VELNREVALCKRLFDIFLVSTYLFTKMLNKSCGFFLFDFFFNFCIFPRNCVTLGKDIFVSELILNFKKVLFFIFLVLFKFWAFFRWLLNYFFELDSHTEGSYRFFCSNLFFFVLIEFIGVFSLLFGSFLTVNTN
jgi:hypothetical protein